MDYLLIIVNNKKRFEDRENARGPGTVKLYMNFKKTSQAKEG